MHITPTQVSWRPFGPPSDTKVDFVEGIKTIAGTGGAVSHEGLASHIYLANASMGKKAFVNSDGDILIIPQQGRLDVQTELGRFVIMVESHIAHCPHRIMQDYSWFLEKSQSYKPVSSSR